jgi:hypothetical protein
MHVKLSTCPLIQPIHSGIYKGHNQKPKGVVTVNKLPTSRSEVEKKGGRDFFGKSCWNTMFFSFSPMRKGNFPFTSNGTVSSRSFSYICPPEFGV